MVHIEHDDAHIAVRVLEAFRDVLCFDVDARLRQQLVQVAPYVNVRLICLLKVRHHIGGAFRSPHLERRLASHNPGCEPQVGYAYDVVGVQVCQEQPVHARIVRPQLEQPLKRTASAIEQQPLVARLHERAHPEALNRRRRRASAKQRYGEIGGHIASSISLKKSVISDARTGTFV